MSEALNEIEDIVSIIPAIANSYTPEPPLVGADFDMLASGNIINR